MRNTIIKCLMFVFILFIIYGAFLYHSSFIVYSVFNEIKNDYETKDNIISLNETQNNGIYTIKKTIKEEHFRVNITVTAYLLGIKLTSISGSIFFEITPKGCIFT